jgi:hypothetical protein
VRSSWLYTSLHLSAFCEIHRSPQLVSLVQEESTAFRPVHAGVFLRDLRLGRVVRRRVVSDISRRERRAMLTAAESRNASATSGSRTATLAPFFKSALNPARAYFRCLVSGPHRWLLSSQAWSIPRRELLIQNSMDFSITYLAQRVCPSPWATDVVPRETGNDRDLSGPDLGFAHDLMRPAPAFGTPPWGTPSLREKDGRISHEGRRPSIDSLPHLDEADPSRL